MVDVPRGIRNNNPGNLREPPDGGDQWLGERVTNDDQAFEEFDTPQYGIRALAKVLLSYYRKLGLCTIRTIITRFAPSTENDTERYISAVSYRLGIPADEEIPVTRRGTLEMLVRAIIMHESGCQPYPEATIMTGINMALKES